MTLTSTPRWHAGGGGGGGGAFLSMAASLVVIAEGAAHLAFEGLASLVDVPAILTPPCILH